MKSVQNKQYKVFINFLKELRIDKNLSQKQLGDLIGVRQTVISKIELSEKNINIIELKTILEAMGISLIDFVTELVKCLEEKDIK